MSKNHPYYLRLWFREHLPWFLINLGFFEKGKDCKSVGANHKWFNINGEDSGCYFCKITSKEVNWEEVKI